MKTEPKTFLADDVLAAAVAAFRINEYEYVKEIMTVQLYNPQTDKYYPNPAYKKKNALLVKDLLELGGRLVLEEDRIQVKEIKDFVQQILTIKILKKDSLGEFDSKMMSIVSDDQVSENLLSVAAYIPMFYHRELRERDIEDRLTSTVKDYLGDPDSKITTTLEIVRYRYSENYNCFFANAVSSDNKRVFFAYSGTTNIEVGKHYSVKATVKRHDVEFTTVLSRVKPVEILTNDPKL